MKFIYFVGTAGSGKSTLINAYMEWLNDAGISVIAINLDPGVDTLPYKANVDIRDWIAIDEVMAKYNLGPNGAQIVAADLMAVNIQKIVDAVADFDDTYALVDTPGQLELFAFRESSKVIIESFGKNDSMVMYLYDPMICKTPNGFISSTVLASLVQFRLELPMINILTKIDVLEKKEIDKLLSWYDNLDLLYDDILNTTNSQTVVSAELFKAIEGVGLFGQMYAASSIQNLGFDRIYAVMQLEFFAGEDDSIDEEIDNDDD
ncbi:MAG: ATP/GTP-binding protein [archaeon]|nr:ATP/GTP-binding protein [archaeon]